jgi:hypothetical protein
MKKITILDLVLLWLSGVILGTTLTILFLN